jgi:hypothetical protein
MPISAKIAFFLVAVTTMACFAVASILMANGDGWAAFALFALAIVLTAGGFITKSKVLRKNAM